MISSETLVVHHGGARGETTKEQERKREMRGIGEAEGALYRGSNVYKIGIVKTTQPHTHADV